MKGTIKTIRSKDKLKNIEYTHIETNSNRVCFMFSGSGYNYDKPLFYYSTMTMFENNIDVIHIHYAYGKELSNNKFDSIVQTMMNDVDPVIKDVLKKNEYTEIIFLGKSLGTIPIVGEIMKTSLYENSKIILLTPLFKLEGIYTNVLNSKQKGLLIIGDKDPNYDKNQIEQLEKNSFKIVVFPNANHSLDVEEFDTQSSIRYLSKVIENIKNFI